MNKMQIAILTGLAATIDEWNALELEPKFGLLPDWYREQLRCKAQAAEQIVDLNYSKLIGHSLSDSERVQACRATKRLAELGFVERIEHKWSDQTAALKLLPPGRAALSGSN